MNPNDGGPVHSMSCPQVYLLYLIFIITFNHTSKTKDVVYKVLAGKLSLRIILIIEKEN